MGDLPKWIEGAAHALALDADAALRSRARDAIDRLLRGQKTDGYLYSNQISLDERFANMRGWHELYDMGHAMEAAVAWTDTTGDDRFLQAMCRSADLIDSCFGSGSGEKRGYDGHPEIELALMKLHRATGEDRYLQLASFFVEERGCEPFYFDVEARARGEEPTQQRHYDWRGRDPYTYYQAHRPLRQQKEAVGHAVRALYLYAGMVDVAVATDDRQLLTTCRRLFRSATGKRMYITGGIGSELAGEALTFDYDLPNETAYAETCASIALVLLAHRLLQVDGDGDYADVIERAMYNGILGGVSLSGDRFYYANPLAVHPRASEGAPDFTSATRVAWVHLRLLSAEPGPLHPPGAGVYLFDRTAGASRPPVCKQPGRAHYRHLRCRHRAGNGVSLGRPHRHDDQPVGRADVATFSADSHVVSARTAQDQRRGAGTRQPSEERIRFHRAFLAAW